MQSLFNLLKDSYCLRWDLEKGNYWKKFYLPESPFAEDGILWWITKTEATNIYTLEYFSAFSAELPTQLSPRGQQRHISLPPCGHRAGGI